MRILIATTLLTICSLGNVQGQTGTAGSQSTPADEKQKGMMQGGMSAMMAHCQMHCRENMTAMTTLSKQVEEARQSNDLNKMRAALDAVAKHHSKMRQHMQTCMRNAQSGDAKPAAPGSESGDHQHHPPGSTPRK
jgi:archaellum biogenesis ATPase FlaH